MPSGIAFLSIRAAACVGVLFILGLARLLLMGTGRRTAVVVAPVPTWTGCYGGLDSGYKWGRKPSHDADAIYA